MKDSELVELTYDECNRLMSSLIPERLKEMPREAQVISDKLKVAAERLRRRRGEMTEFLNSLTAEEIEMIRIVRANKGRADK